MLRIPEGHRHVRVPRKDSKYHAVILFFLFYTKNPPPPHPEVQERRIQTYKLAITQLERQSLLYVAARGRGIIYVTSDTRSIQLRQSPVQHQQLKLTFLC